MTKQLLLLTLSLQVAWVAALLRGLPAGTCKPVCSGKFPQDKVADPANCTKYYICLDDETPSAISFPCPAGQEFDATTTFECVTPADGAPPCVASCTIPPCRTTCTNDPDAIPDPKNCNMYYVCTSGNILGPLECPAGKPYFNSTGRACAASSSVCCSDPCVAMCVAGHAQTQDPYDCHKFYYCAAVGPPDDMYHSTCPSGENFNPATYACGTGVPCNTVCGDITVPGESTTTPSPDCLDSMTCTAVGRFPKCPTCDQQYFNCRNIGQPATVETCTGSLLFNPDPSYPYCVQPWNCPHSTL
ncbi:uncharacterized protein [Procambarus clarkii]|uniref:uncharacterized protein n=1 Tax=Procambarus clarkii TaxID=6728 RepID=UPI00374464BB